MKKAKEYSTIEGFVGATTHICKIKPKRTFDALKCNIAHAFHLGASKVRIYENYRRKNSFVEISKDDFSTDEIESGYEEIQRRNKIKALEYRKEKNIKSIEFYSNSNRKIDIELKALSGIELTFKTK